jgi:hypothetical protein
LHIIYGLSPQTNRCLFYQERFQEALSVVNAQLHAFERNSRYGATLTVAERYAAPKLTARAFMRYRAPVLLCVHVRQRCHDALGNAAMASDANTTLDALLASAADRVTGWYLLAHLYTRLGYYRDALRCVDTATNASVSEEMGSDDTDGGGYSSDGGDAVDESGSGDGDDATDDNVTTTAADKGDSTAPADKNGGTDNTASSSADGTDNTASSSADGTDNTASSSADDNDNATTADDAATAAADAADDDDDVDDDDANDVTDTRAAPADGVRYGAAALLALAAQLSCLLATPRDDVMADGRWCDCSCDVNLLFSFVILLDDVMADGRWCFSHAYNTANR